MGVGWRVSRVPDNLTNGFLTQAQFDLDRATFEEREEIADGLGPVYNAQACAECHQNPVTGATSQITELRAGTLDAFGNFIEPAGRLADQRPRDQRRDPGAASPAPTTWSTFRTSLNILGDGFVEAIADSHASPASQTASRPACKGTIIQVPVLEAPRHHAHRPLRLEEPARQPALVLGRRLPERDGHHQPAAAHREHLDGQLRRGVRHRRPIRKRRRPRRTPSARTSRPSPASCAPPRRRRATRRSRPRRRDRRRQPVQRDRLRHLPRRRRSRPLRRAPSINGGKFTVPAALGDKIIERRPPSPRSGEGSGVRIRRAGRPRKAALRRLALPPYDSGAEGAVPRSTSGGSATSPWEALSSLRSPSSCRRCSFWALTTRRKTLAVSWSTSWIILV